MKESIERNKWFLLNAMTTRTLKALQNENTIMNNALQEIESKLQIFPLHLQDTQKLIALISSKIIQIDMSITYLNKIALELKLNHVNDESLIPLIGDHERLRSKMDTYRMLAHTHETNLKTDYTQSTERFLNIVQSIEDFPTHSQE